MNSDYRPYIVKVAYFVIEVDDFSEVEEFISDQTNDYSYREICETGEYYLEFEVSSLKDTNVPHIGDVKELGVTIVQIWGDN